MGLKSEKLIIGETNTIQDSDKCANGAITGKDNSILYDINRDQYANESHVEGRGCIGTSWYAHAEGAGCYVDGKIAHAEGNTCIASGNDGHAEGNRTCTGRRYYEITSHGVDASLGSDKAYIIIPDAEGDVSSFFPYVGISDVTTRYGAGSQADEKGNIYGSGFTPAVWSGDVPTTPNDLTWALHPLCIVRGISETDILLVRILSSIYSSGNGTKVYYDSATEAFADMIGIYSAYAPTVTINGLASGNGQHSEGRVNSAYGYASHVEGESTRAWGAYSHAEGLSTKATGSSSHSQGNATLASGASSHAEGLTSVASASGSHAEGSGTTASGSYSHAQGSATQAAGASSMAMGIESKAYRAAEIAFANGKFTSVGDAQHCSYIAKVSKAGAGWWEFPLMETSGDSNTFKGLQPNTTYIGRTILAGRQSAGTKGEVGESCGYTIDWGFETRAEYTVASVDVDAKTIDVGASVPNDTRLNMFSKGSVIGGLDETTLYFVVNTSGNTIQLATTSGGSPINLTGVGSGVIKFLVINTCGNTRALIGRTFADDGDTVGDGLTTGIRAALLTNYFLARNPTIQIYGLADRTIRWVAKSEWVEIVI